MTGLKMQTSHGHSARGTLASLATEKLINLQQGLTHKETSVWTTTTCVNLSSRRSKNLCKKPPSEVQTTPTSVTYVSSEECEANPSCVLEQPTQSWYQPRNLQTSWCWVQKAYGHAPCLMKQLPHTTNTARSYPVSTIWYPVSSNQYLVSSN